MPVVASQSIKLKALVLAWGMLMLIGSSSSAFATNVLGVPDTEYSALVTLYNTTKGSTWTNKTNWLTGQTPWYGVVVQDGHVASLDINNNALVGPIPSALANLTYLQWLSLDGNRLTGALPTWLGSLPDLQYLSLSKNQLTGAIPSLANLSGLVWLDLSNNQLTGSLATWLGTLSGLMYIDLSWNQLTGTMPSLAGIGGLQWLDLQGNMLTGQIPEWLGSLTDLQYLALSWNLLNGPIPSSLANLSALQWLALDSCELTGSLPAWLGSYPELVYMSLSWNNLSGAIPTSLGNLPAIVDLDLSHNQLTGSLPTQLGNLTSLDGLYLTDNRLSGSLPSELGNMPNLSYLYVDENQLTGDVPPSFAGLSASMHLSYNGLTASDPAVISLLAQKSPGWQDTQTIAPSNVSASQAGTSSAQVSWTPIPFVSGSGYYEVGFSPAPGGPYTFLPQNRTASKSATSLTVSGLPGGSPNHLVVRAVTLAHAYNQSTITSLPSSEKSIENTAPGKSGIDGSTISLGDMVVSAIFPDCIYAESSDRAFGIRVITGGKQVPPGKVSITGTLRTTDSGERYIDAADITPANVADAADWTVAPVGLTNAALGGGNWRYSPSTNAGQAGVKDGKGLNNIGMLVKVYGYVTEVEHVTSPALPTWFKIDDGSGFPVKCIIPAGVTISTGRMFVVVTGISSCEKPDGQISRLIRVRNQADIVPVQ